MRNLSSAPQATRPHFDHHVDLHARARHHYKLTRKLLAAPSPVFLRAAACAADLWIEPFPEMRFQAFVVRPLRPRPSGANSRHVAASIALTDGQERPIFSHDSRLA